jgi:hypothetical protein
MQQSYFSTTSGRLLLVAAACYLLTAGAYLVFGSLTALGIGMPAAITVSFIAVGLGITDHMKETMLTIMCMPPTLWGFMYLIGEFQHRSANSWGWGIMLLGVLALARAAMGGGAAPAKA